MRANKPYKNDDELIAVGCIHELGHNFGLLIDDHGGIDNVESVPPWKNSYWRYENYKSCLNYRYYKSINNCIIDYSDGTHGRGDFDDWSNLDYSFFKNSYFDWSKA